MKYFDHSKHEWRSKIILGTILAAAACVLGFAAPEMFSLTFSKIGILGISVFVSALVCQYNAKIPNTRIIFEPKNIFAFWGIVWIGVPGGIILGTCASIASRFANGKDKKGNLAGVARDVLSIFLSGVVFYLTFEYFKGPEPSPAAGQIIPNEVLIASLFMAAAHYLAGSFLFLLAGVVKKGQPDSRLMKRIFLFPAAASAVNFLITILLVVAFNRFGIEFGLVVIPVIIAGILAYHFHSRSLVQRTKHISEVSRMHLATVEALATAIDARDQVGAGHVRRTQIYALGLARILGLPDDKVDALRTGVLLHDIGKLAVPDHILNKPGRLTPAETEKTKIYSSVGASILEKVGFPYPVVPTVKYHHEFWDGTGYPERLKGGRIPLTARILTIADAFDTLRCVRPYRAAVSREEACRLLRAGAGTQFDPKIVSTFLSNLRDFEDEIEAEGLAYGEEGDNLIEPRSEDMEAVGYVEQIKRANREVYTLYEMAKEFSSSLSLKETLSLFTKKVGEFVPFDTCLVYLLDEANEFATAVHVEGNNNSMLLGKQIKVGEGVTGSVLKNRKAAENFDPALDFASCREDLGKEYSGMASLPLIADERLIGAISLYSHELAVYEEEHVRLLETISPIAAEAILKSVKQAETETYALTDPMTGLPNARSLQKQFEKEVARAQRAGTYFQVLVLDLDAFKAVNDTFGHKAGDKMLKEVSRIIKEQLREYDFLARYGGDEFVALIPETESTDVLELCRRIESAVCEFVLHVGSDECAKVGVSLGAASYPNHGETFDQMIVAADKAMYSTKAFRKKRKALKEQKLQQSSLESDGSPLYLAEEKVVIKTDLVEFTFDDEPVVELDESHIVSYSAIN